MSLIDVWLAPYEDNDEKKPVFYFLYQTIYTILLVETISCRNIQERILFCFCTADISATWDVLSNAHSLVLSRYSFLVFFLIQNNGFFCWSSRHQVAKSCWGRGYPFLIERQHPPPTYDFPRKVQCHPNVIVSSLWYPTTPLQQQRQHLLLPPWYLLAFRYWKLR